MLPLTWPSVVAYAGVTGLLVLTPGMSTAVVIRNTTAGGRRAGLLTASGIALSNLSWGVASGLGLGVMISHAPGALHAIRVVGAGLLIWLGAKSLLQAWATIRGRARAREVTADAAPTPSDHSRLAEGFATNVLNPGVPVFYVATVPQFIGHGPGFTTAFLALTGIHVVMALSCHSSYAIAFARVATSLADRGHGWLMPTLTGIGLLALAAFSLLG